MTNLKPGEDATSAFQSPTFGQDSSFSVDKPVGSASISPCGRDIVLASRQGLHIIDLDSPWSPPRHLPHLTPWEVADVQWSPFAVRDYWVVSTSNKKALVWNLGMKGPKMFIEHILHAHTRAVTDINFSAHHPDILATCAVDSFVHCWDLRNPARPAMTFCDWFAGATQVKWNRQEGHILASSHDKFLRIWDDRKGAYPLRSIKAHATKICGVDWDRTSVNNVVTCSLDKSIKFWDFTGDEDIPKKTIPTPYPVWRARTTPFGWGLLAMPQRSDFDLHLYDRRIGEDVPQQGTPPPIHRFKGHQEQIKEFLWRHRGTISDGTDNRDFQLVSWGADRTLRLHSLDEHLLKSIGYEKGKKARDNINISRRNALYKTFRKDPSTTKMEGNQTPSLLGYTNPASYSVLGAGMRKPRITILGGRGDTSCMHASIGTRSRVAARKDTDALSWMKGVKIGRRDPHPTSLQQSSASILSPESKVNGGWDTFESLGEEISHVGGNFAKVTLAEIDMSTRSLMASMSGPWGSSKNATYIRCHFEFPSNYPSSAAPIMNIEKTASISSNILSTLNTEIKALSNMYAAHGRSSLESILRYLLGEETLEESTAWLNQPLDSNDPDLFIDAAESSSDEDDAAVPAQMEMSGSEFVSSNANFNVPLPRTCGAIWVDDGRLVCFFPIKEEKSQSLLGSLQLSSGGRPHKYDDSVFEDFGRFRTNLPSKKPLPTSLDEDEDIGSESSFESSSDSSSEGTNLRYQNYYSLVPLRDDTMTEPRSQTADDSYISSIGAANTETIATSSKLTISIYNYRDLLPAKKTLAQQYVVTGSPTECCIQNAKAAQDYGDQNLADIWSFIALLLKDEVPLDMVPHPYKEESILVMARRVLAPLSRAKDSGVDLSTDFTNDVQLKNSQGSIRWGQHPFGRNMLVDRIFQYFEQTADIQMLGILSCILSGSDIARQLVKPVSAAVETKSKRSKFAVLRHPFADMPLLSDMGNRSPLDYFASAEVANCVLQLERSVTLAPENRRGNSTNAASGGSSFGTVKSDTATPWPGNTPPKLYRSSRTSYERPPSQTTSMSVSPELNRLTQRSNSTLTRSSNTAVSRSFFSNSSVSSSPPTSFPKKRVSPSEGYAGILAPKATRSAVSILGKSFTISEDLRTGHNTSGSETDDEVQFQKQPTIKINLKNQAYFHNDSYATVSLLNPRKEWQYQAYRVAYAHLLFVWELPMIRCEILKFNHVSSTTSLTSPVITRHTFPSILTIGKSNPQLSLHDPATACVAIRPNCTTCARTLPPSLTCKSCKRHRAPLICLYCAELIHGLACPCLACGHVLHPSCRNLELHTPEFGGECISGCGCRCEEHTVFEVETVDEVAVEETITGREGGIEREQAGRTERDVAYESLARNLGRLEGVTRKGSVVWRGG